MTITIGPFEHYCTSEFDCGEEIARPGASVRVVRKWAWRNDKGKILKMFKDEEAARAEAQKRGYEVTN